MLRIGYLDEAGTHAAAARPTVLPIRILQLCPAAHLRLSPDDAASRKTRFAVARVWSLMVRVKASASELDFGARRESRFKQMLRPPAPLGMEKAADAS